MTLDSLSLEALEKRLANGELGLRIGPFDVRVSSRLPGVAENLHNLYAAYPLLEASTRVVDFCVSMSAPGPLRRFYRPQVNFYFDGFTPFKPLPQDQAFAMFEWGLNWCISSNAHQYLSLHSAVVARGDKACILPGSPGSGKSTLCAGMATRGWRLLSDEMGLIDKVDHRLAPVPRPVSLKNESIEIMRGYAPEAFIGEVVHDTAKGTVGHMRVPDASVRASAETAMPAMIVFPRYQAGASTELVPLSKGQALIFTADQSFNYHVLGREGFELLADVIDRCSCYQLTYQSMDEAISVLDDLIEEQHG